ncbi:MAG: alpha/beta hydrolase [Pseudomonadota bacterium]
MKNKDRLFKVVLSLAIVVLSACSEEAPPAAAPAESPPPAAAPAAQATPSSFENPVVESNKDAIPPAIATTLREIGLGNNIPAVSALYTPLFSGDIFADMNMNRDLSYGPAERNVLDVVTAKDMPANRPVVVFVHGGGFGGGNKSASTSPFYDNMSYWIASQDLVAVNINYRYAPDSQWPSGIEDLSAVVSWIKQNIATYGGDPNRIFFWGKSTGASHVADYMADRAKKDLPEEITGAIFTSGSYALGDVPLWENYYGADVSLYPERNALPGLVKTNTPILATYAEFDADQYKEQFNILLNAMNAAQKPMETLYLVGHSHMSETYAVGSSDDSLSGPVLDFILRKSGEK